MYLLLPRVTFCSCDLLMVMTVRFNIAYTVVDTSLQDPRHRTNLQSAWLTLFSEIKITAFVKFKLSICNNKFKLFGWFDFEIHFFLHHTSVTVQIDSRWFILSVRKFWVCPQWIPLLLNTALFTRSAFYIIVDLQFVPVLCCSCAGVFTYYACVSKRTGHKSAHKSGTT